MDFVVPGFLVVVGLGSEYFRGRTRRRLVREWAEDKGLHVAACRHSWKPHMKNGLSRTLFNIEVIDADGRRIEARAYTTGFLRRNVIVDWQKTVHPER